tara:strand:+ start:445 stop:2178 length:1734 start_codon:yes stop_codon:yes gene_type:complete
MEVLNFLEEIKAYAENENALAVSRDVNELRGKFGDYILEEERKVQVSELEAQNTPETSGEVKIQAAQKTEELLQLKEKFYAVYNVYKEKKNAIIEEKNSSESKNLTEKIGLIKRLQEVVTSEENIGSAFGALKEIQERWKEIGDIPRDKRNSIQGDYSKLLEDFFYNIKIYKELKDHDFHRNSQLKGKLIEELKQLNEVKSIKEVEAQLKVLQNNWDEIGPVPNEEWEKLKEGYWTEVKSVYNKINRFYDDRRAKLQENLNQKQALLEETKLLVAEKDGLDSVKAWDVVTKKIIATQATWKAVGFGPKKENDVIWKEFRGVCDEFFDAKKAFFGDIQQGFDKLADKKKELIAKAKKLSESQDWKETAGQLKQLQSQWKNIGHSGVKNEQKLWRDFRKACDAFFDARQGHFDAKDIANEENLKLKMAILSAIEKYKPSDDKTEVLAELKKFTSEFNSIGHVPIKQKDEVFNAYKKAMDGHYKSIKMGAEEQAQILFEAKIEMLKGGSNSSRQFDDMKFDLRKTIDAQQKEITQLENNLGFFANSKGANTLKEEVERKVEKAKEKIAGIKAQLKMIPNE